MCNMVCHRSHVREKNEGREEPAVACTRVISFPHDHNQPDGHSPRLRSAVKMSEKSRPHSILFFRQSFENLKAHKYHAADKQQGSCQTQWCSGRPL
jgi:hypothetical protein